MAPLVDAVDGLVHEPTQVGDDGEVDLTVQEIYMLSTPGGIDFGGGELTDVERRPHPKLWRNEDDDYQWWYLNAGTYLLEYNESLSEQALLQPRTALVERGGFHPTLRTATLPRVPLHVGGQGLHVKENARLSTLYPL